VRRPPLPNTRRVAAAIALATLLAVGCGDDDEQGEQRAVTVPAGEAITVVGREYSFDPSRIVVTGASGAAGLELRLDNRGSLAHNLKVERDGRERDGRELGGTPTFQGGEARAGRVRLEPGEYTMVCTVGDHEQLGMKGELVVRD
jgi:plastocyanin